MLTLLVGGARSGKSSAAVRLAARWARPVVAIVTGEPTDEEMAARIARHRDERPDAWETLEEPLDLASALARVPDDAGVILDCLTLWVANAMAAGLEDAEVEERARAAATRMAERPGDGVVVSNDVGSGIVPMDPLTRRYRDLLGRVNAIWGEAADHVLLVLAGRAIPLRDPLELVDG